MSRSITTTSEQLGDAFAEWLRRYNEEPDRFTEEFGEPAEYGEGCAEYLIKLLDGQSNDEAALPA